MSLPVGFWRAFGPGLMWAATAIGVSHLVQSTRAGALAGFGLAGVILFALILKYPFFEYGPRYSAATGRSLVEGYRRIGRWALWLYFVMTLVTAVIHQVALLLLLAFLIQFTLGPSAPPVWVIGGSVYVACSLLLAAGRFRGLDLVIKAVVVVLAVSTLVAAAIAVPRADLSTLSLSPLAMRALPLGFILALVGFMPAPVDMSVMSSLWTLAKDRTVGERSSVEVVVLDFRIGYVATAFFALAFLMLGAVVMHGSGETFSEAGPAFSTQLVELYTSMLGDWTRPVVMVAVLTTVFSSVLVIIDGYPRVLDRCLPNIRGEEEPGRDRSPGRGYWVMLVAFGVLNVLGLSLFTQNLTPMIDFATIFSFATAPVLGYLNLRAMTSDDVPQDARPGRAMLALSYLGLALLGGMTVLYLVSRIT